MRRTRLLLVPILTMAMSSSCSFIARSSVSSGGTEGNGASRGPSVSGDGRYVAFTSSSTNLVPGDINGVRDVFVRDHKTGDTARISVSTTGEQALRESFVLSISDDGRYVAFGSAAPNLVPGDANGRNDAFVHDRSTGVTELVSVSSTGVQGNDSTSSGALSGDGRFFTFSTFSTNLVAGDTNGFSDVFVHDRTTGVTERVSVSSTGVQGNGESFAVSINRDGRYVDFASDARNLVVGDTSSNRDAFLHDRVTHSTERVSVSSDGGQPSGLGTSIPEGISSDGRYVALYSNADNLVPNDTTRNRFDVYLRDRATGTTELISVNSAGVQGNNESFLADISDDGRYVAFYSMANNLVSDDTNGFIDFFVRDRATGVTQRVSLDTKYQEANAECPGGLLGPSFTMDMSSDGRYIAFASCADTLSQGDTNQVEDVFLRFTLAPHQLVPSSGVAAIPRGTTQQLTLLAPWLDPTSLFVLIEPSQGITIDRIAVRTPIPRSS